MIIDFRSSFENLAGCQVVLKVQQQDADRSVSSGSALRGQIYETVECCLQTELARLLPRPQRKSIRKISPTLAVMAGSRTAMEPGRALDLVRLELEKVIEPLLQAQQILLKELILHPLTLPRLAQDPSEPRSARLRALSRPVRLDTSFVEVTAGPILTRDRFWLTVEVVCRVRANVLVLERAGLAANEPMMAAALQRDVCLALEKLGPQMFLEDWNRSAGERASALLQGLQFSPFGKLLDRAHKAELGADHEACIEACWITSSLAEPALDAVRPLMEVDGSLQLDPHLPPREA